MRPRAASSARLLRVMAASSRSAMVMGAEVASRTVRVSPRRLFATPRAGPDTRSRSSTMSWVVWLAIGQCLPGTATQTAQFLFDGTTLKAYMPQMEFDWHDAKHEKNLAE